MIWWSLLLALTDAKDSNKYLVIINDLFVNNPLKNPGLGDAFHFVCQKLGKSSFELPGFIGICFLVLIDARDSLYMFLCLYQCGHIMFIHANVYICINLYA